MSQFRENLQTEGRTEGWTNHILQDPSGRGRGSNKENHGTASEMET